MLIYNLDNKYKTATLEKFLKKMKKTQSWIEVSKQENYLNKISKTVNKIIFFKPLSCSLMEAYILHFVKF